MIDQIQGFFSDAASNAGNGDGMMSVKDAAYIIGMVIMTVISGLMGKRAGFQEGRVSQTEVTNWPKGGAVPRGEYDDFKIELREKLNEIKAALAAVAERIDRRYESLDEDVKETAQNAYEGRQKLWQELNPLRDRVSAIEASGKERLAMAEAVAESCRRITGQPPKKTT